jgi:catechol 2,3-dioxygenase-like lactoylglutathione lyase family enzyme
MLAHHELMAFVATTDLERATSFYGTTLGLPLLGASPFASTFDAAGTPLRVTLAESVDPAPYTVLGWRVLDIESTAAELLEQGVTPLRYSGFAQDELGIWDAPGGARVVWFHDLDRNVLSLSQEAVAA